MLSNMECVCIAIYSYALYTNHVLYVSDGNFLTALTFAAMQIMLLHKTVQLCYNCSSDKNNDNCLI